MVFDSNNQTSNIENVLDDFSDIPLELFTNTDEFKKGEKNANANMVNNNSKRSGVLVSDTDTIDIAIESNNNCEIAKEDSNIIELDFGD